METAVLFHETQRFRQWWVNLLFIGLNLFAIYFTYMQIYEHVSISKEPISDTEALIAWGSVVFSTVLFYSLKLETKVTRDGIYVRFFPFKLSFGHYTWARLTSCFIRSYQPLGEFGGWGIRYSFNNGKALNVSGNIGLQLIFDKGRKLLIGTKKHEELQKVLSDLHQLKNA